CYEDGFKSVADGYLTVSKAGLARIRQFFDDAVSGSARGLAAAVEAAASMQPRPKTLVILARGVISDEDVNRIVAAADAASSRVVTVILSDEERIIEKMKQLSERPKIKGSWTSYGQR
ncbi:MAG: hypothetical protein ACYTF6_10875, partial [Planctomycetota bacterium]